MLPSLLANEVRSGLRQFLVTGFEPSDERFAGIMGRFAEDESRWIKGPFVQIGLPFRQGSKGKAFFADFETRFPGFVHQELAWARLDSRGQPKPTVVATGTGSGKTEAFLYPVLDHCAREARAGKRGIKALIIYPMNALASDQARRIAGMVAGTPAFNGLRVGLYVGGGKGRGQMTMSPTEVITDRDTLRAEPPDILLTNYKMLDYLLIRPKDRLLWDRNTPETLRYIVVDELHTFDGAQGTDLAILLRRLRARLKSPAGTVVPVGTSATLGGGSDTAPLREYARQVFGADFPEDSVVTENRVTELEFLGEGAIDHVLYPMPGMVEQLNPTAHLSLEAAIASWFGLFFPGAPTPADVNDPAWRLELGALLKRHLLFVNLLKVVKGRILSVDELRSQMQGPVPEVLRPHMGPVLDALLALVGWARSANDQPFVNLRIQLWIRELRRMVANVDVDASAIQLRSANDLTADTPGIHLPLVQCPECRATAWLSRKPVGRDTVTTELEAIYNSWFGEHPEILRLYHPGGLRKPRVDGLVQHLCTRCGCLQHADGACQACSHPQTAPVFQVTATRSRTGSNGTNISRHNKSCPACGTDSEPILLGVRSTTLGAITIEQSWATPFNDDKKLIAFSDSVQDAAHRAGFFAARTFLNNVRIALAKVISGFPEENLPWDEFLKRTHSVWFDPASPLAMDPERFVSEFIGPNMTWLKDWDEGILENGKLPRDSRLPELVAKRLRWQAFAEFTYLGRRGRNLETLGAAVLALPPEPVDAVARQLHGHLVEHYGLRSLSQERVFQWLWGMLMQMKLRGGVADAELDTYFTDGRLKGFLFAPGRRKWIPAMGRRTQHPKFVVCGEAAGSDHDQLSPATGRSFYAIWTERVLAGDGLLGAGADIEICGRAFEALSKAGVLVRREGQGTVTFGLNPAALVLSRKTSTLRSTQGRKTLVVPSAVADRLVGMPCLQSPYEDYALRSDGPDSLASRLARSDLRRVYAAEHTGLLERGQREELEARFKAKEQKPWYENLLSATPTLEMGVDIGDLSSVMLCSVPPTQASHLQRVGRAGRLDGNAFATTIADGSSPHDLYFFEDTMEMLAGEVTPPGIFLKAPEVLRRQLFAFCMDDWVGTGLDESALPDKTKEALDARDADDAARFPSTFLAHVRQHEKRLLAAFKSLLAPDLDKRVEDRLTEFMEGSGQEDPLKIRLTKLLDELSRERRAHKKRADDIAGRLRELARQPQDEATKAQIDALDAERQKALELAKEINQRDLLNALTDAGLIPNYAFPEAGIELKSLLWRRKDDEERGTGPAIVALPAMRYERPAQSALSEFAPENVFYANQRKVEIDQINLDLSSVESWRLCPTCQHMNNESIASDTSGACPSCGDPMWSNVAQVRSLLRFRQAVANSEDSRVRIDDGDEDREPKFYVRQMMTDFKPEDVELAYKVKSEQIPFGFEFIRRVVFRDVNFGEAGKGNETYSVAGIDRARPGFVLCRHCGQVQRRPRNQAERERGQIHAFDCPQRTSAAPENLINCLYLYREFTSEALRVLVPFTRAGVDEASVESFMAALRVGLKARFGGKVDHLRLMTQEEKPRDGGASRHFVVLYDSVPGGTGYLRELLADNAKTLLDVIQLALEKIQRCSCNADPDKDGCYRCVYQHRLGKAMTHISRNRARAILEELLGALSQLEATRTIRDIYVNPNFDSELESKFVEALARLGGKQGLPRVELVPEVVNGRSGYLLISGENKYWVVPQLDIGPSDGVSVMCRPDFVIRPVQGGSARLPIAVFCDGWAYHKGIVREDACKRNALVASGKYWVWTVTWSDVKAAMEEKADAVVDNPLPAAAYVPAIAEQLKGLAYSPWDGANAMARLIRWLGSAVADGTDPQVRRHAKHAAYLAGRLIPHPMDALHEDRRRVLRDFWDSLSDLPCPIPAGGVSAPSGNAEPAPVSLRYHWHQSLKDPPGRILPCPGFVILDFARCADENARRLAWQQWLELYNLFQALPGAFLADAEGLVGGDYQSIVLRAATAGAQGRQGGLDAAWAGIVAQAHKSVAQGVLLLKAAGATPPEEVGYELPEQGEVVAQAELAWPTHKVALVLNDPDSVSQLTSRSWKVVTADTPDWHLRILQFLQT